LAEGNTIGIVGHGKNITIIFPCADKLAFFVFIHASIVQAFDYVEA
jgi:hypothetical protein